MSRHRIVCNVEWARETTRPLGLPRPKRLRGSKGAGISYERRFAKEIQRGLPHALHGQWFEYCADGKRGYCQPDVLVHFALATLVLECKLRNVEEAQGQIVQLYSPVLQRAYNKPVRAIIVARSLSALPSDVLVARTLLEALQMANAGEVPVLHWLGRGPL